MMEGVLPLCRGAVGVFDNPASSKGISWRVNEIQAIGVKMEIKSIKMYLYRVLKYLLEL